MIMIVAIRKEKMREAFGAFKGRKQKEGLMT
jgi:hypothetical protein